MVDFKKRLGKSNIEKPIDPITIYDTLDRSSDKGELRRAQNDVLSNWHKFFRNNRDVILKLHTGQGKTLIGLLMLQSKLNEGANSAVYLCPNNYLIDQTCLQAKQFGLRHCTMEGELPSEFLDGKSILITVAQKLFNGRTKFELGSKSIPVDAILMDDCHACIDAIRHAITILFEKNDDCYKQLIQLFSASLEFQGAGSFADIRNGNTDSILPVPYWDWRDKLGEVVKILAARVEEESKKKPKDGVFPKRHALWFAWPLIKDSIQDCACVVSGGYLQITPRIPPLDIFGSFHNARHRVFMSATVTDDSFLIKGLKLSPETIKNPLVYKNEKWAGEKMVLIPSLINDTLTRSIIVQEFAKPRSGRDFGVVALVPSFGSSKDWERYGSRIATTKTIREEIDRLRSESCDTTLVIANRYDGIDLPDDVCRILIFDSRPFSEDLLDRYEEHCRPNSVMTIIRIVRTIEQGLGRSVRGEKDYSAILIVGPELVRMLRTEIYRQHFSQQTQTQIEIGLEIAELATEEIKNGATPLESINNLIRQCLVRDDGWKAFYIEKMDATALTERDFGTTLEIYKSELEAETMYQNGNPPAAIKTIQTLIDKYIKDSADVGWYLQEIARYTFGISRDQSNKLQLEAHTRNKFLLKPVTGVLIIQLVVSHQRMENIIQWVRGCHNCEELNNRIQDILTSLHFGIPADRFERAFNELGEALGFSAERPDKQWKEGPDNLWALEDGHYLVVECKSGVALDRADIVKDEAGQMNTSCAWFSTNYHGCKCTNILIIPTHRLARGSAFNEKVQIMREKELKLLNMRVRSFFAEFQALDWNSLSEGKIQELINLHALSVKDIIEKYCIEPR